MVSPVFKFVMLFLTHYGFNANELNKNKSFEKNF